MIVPPGPVPRPGRTRRALRAVALGLPVALLIVAVGAGVLGPPPEPQASPPASAEAAAPPSAPSGPRRPAWIPTDATPSFPDAVAGLPVRTVPDAAVRLDEAGDRPIAVAGWLGELEPPASCPVAEGGDTRGTLSPLCVRHARLVVADPGSSRPGAHLHLTVPPGVRLPEAFERRDTAGSAVAPVVLVGRAKPTGGGLRRVRAGLPGAADGRFRRLGRRRRVHPRAGPGCRAGGHAAGDRLPPPAGRRDRRRA